MTQMAIGHERPFKLTLSACVIIYFLLLALASSVLAESRGKTPPKQICIPLTLMYAYYDKESKEENLTPLQRQLRKTLPYNKYETLLSKDVILLPARESKVPLIDNMYLLLEATSIDSRVRLGLCWIQEQKDKTGKKVKKNLVKTTLGLSADGEPVLIGGPRYKKGVLIVVLQYKK